MKILMINVVCGIRSTGRICTDRAQELEAQGHEVRIAYGRGSVPARYQKYAVRIGNDLDVRLHALQARIFDAAGFGSRRVTERFICWVRDYNPDEIHLHNLHGYYINVEVLFGYLRTCGKRILWTLHDCWAFTGHCAHYMASRCEQWKDGCAGPCPEKRQYPVCWLLSRSRSNYKKKKSFFCGIPQMRLTVPSEWLNGEVRKSFLREYPVEVRHNDIDRHLFRPTVSDFRERYGLTGKKLLLGVASTWTERKGWSDYLRLSSMLGDTYQMILVGISEDQKKSLSPKVLGIARTDRQRELAAIYTAADVFLNLTYEDNYPTVNLEAEACGTPVITYDTGGCRETVSREDSAVVPQGDLQAVCRIIEKITAVQNAAEPSQDIGSAVPAVPR